MGLESFYGGRQGASFIIVKHFDVIDTTKAASSYKGTYLAVTSDPLDASGRNTYLYDGTDFIERDGQNYADYAWAYTVLDGSLVPTKTSISDPNPVEMPLPLINAEGMVQCFSQGGDTTDIVNYGEYVIIDSPNKNDPDNGKVYRRGLFYDDGLAGAEYIGQIVGPQGESPEIAFGTEAEVQEHPGYINRAYTLENDSIVPGKVVNYNGRTRYDAGTYYNNVYTEVLNDLPVKSPEYLYEVVNGTTLVLEYYSWNPSTLTWAQEFSTYNDEITYSWVNIKDSYGHEKSVLIGFTIPFLTEEFFGVGVSAYYNKDADGDRVNKNLVERLDDGSHPYYRSWKICIPDGIKGDAITQLETIDTQVKSGTTYYNNTACTRVAGTTSAIISLDSDNIDYSLTYLPIVIGGITYYIKNNGEDTCTSVLRYTETNYDKSSTGTRRFITLSPYNVIKDVSVNADGEIYIDFTYSNLVKVGTIKLITNVTIDGQLGNGTQKVNVHYNDGTVEEIGDPLNYILEMKVSESRPDSIDTPPYHLLILYSDPAKRAAIVAAGENATYISTYPDIGGNYLRNDWHDLGDVHGEKTALAVITILPNVNLLEDDSAASVAIPPEYIMYSIQQRSSTGTYIYNPPAGLDTQYTGWLVAVDSGTQDPDLYAYDYSAEDWYLIGSISGSLLDPTKIIAFSSENIAPVDLNTDGMWVVLNTATHV